MGTQDGNELSQVTKEKLGEVSSFRGRLFFCCVTRQDMMLLVDDRKTLKAAGYSNLFIPTVCGECERRTAERKAARTFNFDEVRIDATSKYDNETELVESLVEGWEAYKAVLRFCDDKDGVAIFSQIVNRDVVEREVKKYDVQMSTAKLERSEDAKELQLKMLPYFDPRFL